MLRGVRKRYYVARQYNTLLSGVILNHAVKHALGAQLEYNSEKELTMIIEATTLVSVFGQVREWLNRTDTINAKNSENIRAAIKSLHLAAFETKAYLAATEKRKEPQNYETENKLSRLWVDASADLFRIESDSVAHDLAQRCILKGDYWADPSAWSEAQIEQSNIDLEGIIEEGRKLL